MSGAAQVPFHRPMTLGEILERIFRLLRANLKLLVGIAAVPGIAMLITYGFVLTAVGIVIFNIQQGGKPPGVAPLVVPILVAYFGMILIHLAVFALYLAAASFAAVHADRGSPVTFRESYRIAWSRGGHYVCLILTMYAICFLPALLLQIPMFGAFALLGVTQTTPSLLMILLLPVVIVLSAGVTIAGMLVGLRLSLAFPVSVFESLKVRDALKRSWALTRGALGRIFLVMLVIYAAMYAATMVVVTAAMCLGAIGYLMFSGTNDHPSMHAIWFLAGCVAIAYLVLIAFFTACCWAGFSTAFAVIYNDQRTRIDGLPASLAPAGVLG
jgi:hypothetical protein